MTAEFLRRSALFKDFTPVGLQIFAKIARPRILLAGKPLFTEGSASESLFLIVEGRVQIALKGADGRDVPIAALGPNDHLGELSLLSPKPVTHLCSAIAESDSKIFEITKADFATVQAEKPQACMKLLLAIGQELAVKAVEGRDSLRSALGRALAR